MRKAFEVVGTTILFLVMIAFLLPIVGPFFFPFIVMGFAMMMAGLMMLLPLAMLILPFAGIFLVMFIIIWMLYAMGIIKNDDLENNQGE